MGKLENKWFVSLLCWSAIMENNRVSETWRHWILVSNVVNSKNGGGLNLLILVTARSVSFLLECFLVHSSIFIPSNLINSRYHWWLASVTLVLAFGFLPQNFGRWWGPINSILSFYEYRFSDGDTIWWWGHSNTLCKRICLNILHCMAAGMYKLRVQALALRYHRSRPRGISTT